METVQMMNTMPLEEEKEDVLKVEELVPVDYKKLSKEELIGIIEEKDKVHNQYEDKIHDMEDGHKKEMDTATEYYLKRIEELKALTRYYERKLKLLKDIITIETGDEK
jgi:hypothetical protein